MIARSISNLTHLLRRSYDDFMRPGLRVTDHLFVRNILALTTPYQCFVAEDVSRDTLTHRSSSNSSSAAWSVKALASEAMGLVFWRVLKRIHDMFKTTAFQSLINSMSQDVLGVMTSVLGQDRQVVNFFYSIALIIISYHINTQVLFC